MAYRRRGIRVYPRLRGRYEMTRKTKKMIRIVIGIVLILAIVIYCFVKCNRKQYVSIRIACQEGDEPIDPDRVLTGGDCKDFPMGTDSMFLFPMTELNADMYFLHIVYIIDRE